MQNSINENRYFPEFEIVIIGGGPAGSTAAIYLSKAGLKVALFEMKEFPREVLCGEFISFEVYEVLNELNLWEEFLSYKPNIINNVSIVGPTGKQLKSPLNFSGYGLKRSMFDNMLLKKAMDSGACIFQPAKVTDVQKENRQFKIIYYYNGQSYNTSANKVIAAYGKQNFLDKKFSRSFTENKSHFNGIKFHLPEDYIKDLNKDEIKIFSYDNFYCGVNFVNDNIGTICMLENHSKTETPPKNLLKKFFYYKNDFSELSLSVPEEKWDLMKVYGCGNIFFGNRKIVENGIFYIGDAAHVIAPLAGDGIAMALQSGKLISEIITDQKILHLSDSKTKKLYIKSWNRKFKKRIMTASIIQKIIFNNYFKTIIFYLISFFPSILKYLIGATRNKDNIPV